VVIQRPAFFLAGKSGLPKRVERKKAGAKPRALAMLAAPMIKMGSSAMLGPLRLILRNFDDLSSGKPYGIIFAKKKRPLYGKRGRSTEKEMSV